MPERIAAAEELARFLGMLSHPDRIRIIQLLRHAGPLEVRQIRESLGLPPSRLSQHLTLLKTGRLLVERKSGRQVIYDVCEPALGDWLLQGLDLLRGDELRSTVARAKERWQSAPP
jgi:DNA-binding transcriptional ArsR family regulator